MKKIIDYWPLITVCVLTLGYFNLSFYYSSFHIDILSFASPSDILLSLLPQVLVLFSVIISFFFSSLQQQIIKIRKDVNSSYKVEESEPMSLPIWLRDNIGWIIFYYIIFCSILLFILHTLLHFKLYQTSQLLIWMIVFFVLLAYLQLLSYDKVLEKLSDRPFIVIVAALCILVLIIMIDSRSRAEKIIDGVANHNKNHVSFLYTGNAVITTDSLLLIGTTTNYLFLYNMKDSSTQVYESSKLEKLVLR